MKNIYFICFYCLLSVKTISQIDIAGFTDQTNMYRRVFITDSFSKIEADDTVFIVTLDKILYARATEPYRLEANEGLAINNTISGNISFYNNLTVFDSVMIHEQAWSDFFLKRSEYNPDFLKFFVFKSNNKIQCLIADSCDSFVFENLKYNFKEGFIEATSDDGTIDRINRNDFNFFCFKVLTDKWQYFTYLEIYWKEKAYIEEFYTGEKSKKLLYYNCSSQ